MMAMTSSRTPAMTPPAIPPTLAPGVPARARELMVKVMHTIITYRLVVVVA